MFLRWYYVLFFKIKYPNNVFLFFSAVQFTNLCIFYYYFRAGKRNYLSIERRAEPRRRKERVPIQLRELGATNQRIRHDVAGIPQVQRDRVPLEQAR